MIIKLTKDDQATVRQQARLRGQLTSLTRKADEKKSSYDDFEIDILGVMAEVCFAKLFDKPTILDRGIDDGTDFYLHNIAVDVKGSKTDKLWFKRKDAFKSDVAVLMMFKDNTSMECLGFIDKKKYIDNCQVNPANGTFFLEAKKLYRIDRLWYKYQANKLGGNISEY